MTWQLAAFAILFVGLAGGFAWYERTRPDARVVALVATLAAFAALGRIAFAALPNIKPTTDIVLISGYVLGPAPGFVVGALAGLTSNFFFGQGPWTPWQMAAWGATGLVGAGLAVVTGRRIGRWPLALVCTVVGFAFTAFLDFGDWVTYSDHSPAQLGVYVGKGLGFDAIHAAGCLVFALAFGPALIRAITRFATRLQVTWRSPTGVVAPLLVIGLVASGWGAAHASTTPAGYLLSAQNPDGGFGPAPGQPSTHLFAGWAALGLAAEGYNPRTVVKDGHSLTGYLSSGAVASSDPGSLERTILAAAAAGENPGSFGGRDLVAALQRDIAGNGSVSGQTNLTAFAVLALRAAGISPPAKMTEWLVRQEDQDGGFNFGTAGAVSDVDDTGAVLEALGGESGPGVARARGRAVSFIRGQQESDGGFPASAGAASNAQSTAWAIQGLLAAGMPVTRALHYLGSLVAPDGHVRYSRATDQTPVWVTAEAAMALAGKPLPLVPVSAKPVTRPHTPRRARATSPRRSAPARDAQRPRHVSAAQSAPSRLSQTLATDAGILDALALAPLGVG
ncbi:MAG TPA: prenyltransferase/squalene oxidase repeat-containing protein [Solirubrobacteraceae bacterium]